MSKLHKRITKAAALAAFDGRPAALAAALGITPSAISQWPDGPIPENRSRQLRFEVLPDYDWDRLLQDSQPAEAA